MNRDLRLKVGILLGTLGVGGGLAGWLGLRFPWSDGIAPFAVVAVLGPCAVFYQRRQVEPFVVSLLACMQILLFTACFTVLMYSLAALGAPLADDFLMTADATLGVHTPDIVRWSQSHPWLYEGIGWAYDSVIVQTLCVILILGFRGDRREVEQYVLRFMVALLITAALFSAMPAKGPFATYGLEARPTQQRYLQHLEGLRSGELRSVSLREAEGLVTFPSFHTTWAILLAAAFWHRKRLFIPFALLNGVVIAGTLTTGWHYFVDVLGGVAVAVVTILLSRRLRRWIDAGEQRTERQQTGERQKAGKQRTGDQQETGEG